MNETIKLLLAWVAGGVLGTIIFGGLWWTIRRGFSSNRPTLWFFGSLLVRLSIALVGFYFVSAGHWQRLLVCLFGFIIARLVVTWLTRTKQRASHAS